MSVINNTFCFSSRLLFFTNHKDIRILNAFLGTPMYLCIFFFFLFSICFWLLLFLKFSILNTNDKIQGIQTLLLKYEKKSSGSLFNVFNYNSDFFNCFINFLSEPIIHDILFFSMTVIFNIFCFSLRWLFSTNHKDIRIN